MSLDVYLKVDKVVAKPKSSGIFIRENGATVEISEDDWNDKHPDQQPVKIAIDDYETTTTVYQANITHNLGKMASEAGLYEALWRPHRLKDNYNIPEDDYQTEYKFEEENPSIAKDIIGKLALGLDLLKKYPDDYKKFNPENGWGDYDGLVKFVEKYLDACQEYPDAIIHVSR